MLMHRTIGLSCKGLSAATLKECRLRCTFLQIVDFNLFFFARPFLSKEVGSIKVTRSLSLI